MWSLGTELAAHYESGTSSAALVKAFSYRHERNLRCIGAGRDQKVYIECRAENTRPIVSKAEVGYVLGEAASPLPTS